MKRLATIGVMAFAGMAAIAQPPGPGGPPGGPGGPPPGALPPPPPRARGPQLMLAVEMAQAAIASCAANTWKVTALVVDRAGVPVALLSSDGVGGRTQNIATMKANNLVNHFAPGAMLMPMAGTDPAMVDRFKWDESKGVPHQGGVPLMAGSDFIGAIAVSGAPGGDKDEACAQAGADKVKARLR